MRKINKRGEGAVGMSFGWIFSIILIVLFIFVAIYTIKSFLNMAHCTKVGSFYESLEENVRDAYGSSSSSFEMKIEIPGVEYVCFANLSEKITGPIELYEELMMYEGLDYNTFILPADKACDMPARKVPYINLTKTTRSKNPLCFDVSGGGSIRLVKEPYDRGVTIK